LAAVDLHTHTHTHTHTHPKVLPAQVLTGKHPQNPNFNPYQSKKGFTNLAT